MAGFTWKTLATAAIVTSLTAVAFEAASRQPSLNEMRDQLYMPHFAKMAGIYEGLREENIPLSGSQRQKGDLAVMLYEDYTGRSAAAATVAHAEGLEEAKARKWSPSDFEAYADQVIARDQQVFMLAEDARSFLQGRGLDETEASRHTLRAIGMAIHAVVSGAHSETASLSLPVLEGASLKDFYDYVGDRISENMAMAHDIDQPGRAIGAAFPASVDFVTDMRERLDGIDEDIALAGELSPKPW